MHSVTGSSLASMTTSQAYTPPIGYRNLDLPPEEVKDFAHKVIDAGADAYLGHGPHVMRGIEIYKGKPIFYSLGNFVFQSTLIRRQPSDLFDLWGLTGEQSTVELVREARGATRGLLQRPVILGELRCRGRLRGGEAEGDTAHTDRARLRSEEASS